MAIEKIEISQAVNEAAKGIHSVVTGAKTVYAGLRSFAERNEQKRLMGRFAYAVQRVFSSNTVGTPHVEEMAKKAGLVFRKSKEGKPQYAASAVQVIRTVLKMGDKAFDSNSESGKTDAALVAGTLRSIRNAAEYYAKQNGYERSFSTRKRNRSTVQKGKWYVRATTGGSPAVFDPLDIAHLNMGRTSMSLTERQLVAEYLTAESTAMAAKKIEAAVKAKADAENIAKAAEEAKGKAEARPKLKAKAA